MASDLAALAVIYLDVWPSIQSALTAQPANVDPSPDQQPQNSQEAQPPNDGGSVPLGSKDISPSGTGELHSRPEQPGNREPSTGLPQALDTNVDGRTQGSPDLDSVVDGSHGSKGILPSGDGS